MGTTNYVNTFIAVAEDCPAGQAEAPAKAGSIAQLQHELVATQPYTHTSDDVLFAVHVQRQGIAEADRPSAREAFFGKDQACLRASPLGKRHGWGIHHDAEARVALVPVGSAEYAALVADPAVKVVKAMRSKRA